MPFTKHVEYGPDKLPAEVASADGTPLKSAWTGVVMYGPLCMTGTGVATWRQATLSLDALQGKVLYPTGKGGGKKSDVAGHKAQLGKDADVLTLAIDGKEFVPDYYRNENSTHYYRLQGSKQKAESSKRNVADVTELRSLLSLANERVDEQTRWNAMEKKVPDYAPWAPNGYQRLQEAIKSAEQIINSNSQPSTLNPDEVETATAALNKAINTMRPGNLAEMEDLYPLSALLRRAGTPDESSPEELRRAVGYGKMVVRYVTDGSGTKDMIKAAVERLKKAIGN